MSDDLMYATEQLGHAVETLVGPDPLEDRMHNAYAYRLVHVSLDAVPERVRPQLSRVLDRCGATPPRNMTRDELRDLARTVVEVYEKCLEEYARATAPPSPQGEQAGE